MWAVARERSSSFSYMFILLCSLQSINPKEKERKTVNISPLHYSASIKSINLTGA